MAQKTRQAYQYEAPVTPSKWTGEEQRFSLRVKAALEDLYQKFGRLSSNPAADSEKLGGKAPEYYLTPVNLLDNSDFRKPVNQRGNTEITGDWIYGIDRWLASTKYEQNPNGSILITDNGLSMGYWTDMMQLIPFEQLKSKTLTFAVCTENGVYAYTMTLPESVPPVGGGAMYFGDGIWNDIIVMETIKYDNNDSVLFRFRNAQTTNQLVYWAALYEGSYTADTLPPYVPKGYRAELDACHERFYRFDDPYSFVATGFFNKKGAYAYLAIDTPYLNGDAKATVTGKVHLSYPATVGDDSPVTSTILSGAAAHDGKIRLQCILDTANSALANMPCAIHIRAGDYLEISRDL